MKKDEVDSESELLSAMFDEIMKMIRQKQIRVESIIQAVIEQDILTQDSCDKTSKILSEHAKRKQWVT